MRLRPSQKLKERTLHTAEKISQIEAICGREVGRGIQELANLSRGGLLEAAKSIAGHSSPSVTIITGCFIPKAHPPAAETDGPVGAVHLASGLAKAGIPVCLVTDLLCADAVKAAVRAADLTIPVHIFPYDRGYLITPTSHLVAIERPGPAKDGTFRNMRGEDISAWTAPMQEVFCGTGAVTIGIGDGGNELGMGRLPPGAIERAIFRGETIACTVGCDHLIVCGVSNWGGLGLLAALSLLRPEWPLLSTVADALQLEYRILKTMLECGPAVDGVTGVGSLSVDGLAWEYHAQITAEILGVCNLPG